MKASKSIQYPWKEDLQHRQVVGNRQSRTVSPSLTALIVQFFNSLSKNEPVLHLIWEELIRSQLMWKIFVARCTHQCPQNKRKSAIAVLKERIRFTPNPLIYLQTKTHIKSLASRQSSIKGKIIIIPFLQTNQQFLWAKVRKASSIFECLSPSRSTAPSKRPSL